MNKAETGMNKAIETIKRDMARWREETSRCKDFKKIKGDDVCGNCVNAEYGFVIENGLAIKGCYFCMKHNKIVQYSKNVPVDRVNNKYSVRVKDQEYKVRGWEDE